MISPKLTSHYGTRKCGVGFTSVCLTKSPHCLWCGIRFRSNAQIS